MRGNVAKGIFVGLATIDVVYGVDAFPAPNAKTVANSQDVFVGGPATNASIAFGHLGGQSTLVSGVGRHPIAGVIKDEAQRSSVRLIDLNPSFDQAPVVSSIAVNKAGERNVVSANANRVEAPTAQADESVLDQASVLLVDGHFMQACKAWAKAARARGIHVVLDGGSWKEGTAELLENVDTAICSADFKPPQCRTEDDVLKYLKDRNVVNVAITHGGEPVRFVSATSAGTVRVPKVDVVDTMGAGDIFHGAFCYFFADGNGLVGSLVEATRIASESCGFRGTREWMKYVGERTMVS
jgi:sugar/nucleoside kinase (ribokinase family)